MKSSPLFILAVGLIFAGTTAKGTGIPETIINEKCDTLPATQQSKYLHTQSKEVANKNQQAAISNGNGATENAPKKHFAQDFNTTRSNRERGMGLVINISNDGTITSDSMPARQEAQDFNTTRSNRERGMGLVINIHNGDTGVTDSMPVRQEAQDFNTTRSNRERGMGLVINIHNGNSGADDVSSDGQKTQDHNSSHSKKSGTIVINIFNDAAQSGFNKSGGDQNPLYEDGGRSGVNPLFEGRGALKGSGGNSTGSFSPTGQKAQDHNSSRSNKSSVLLLDAGFSSGIGDFTRNGWNASLEYQIPLSRLFSIAAGAGFGFLGFDYKLPATLPEKIAGPMKESFTSNAWNIVTLSAGPVLNWERHKLQAGIYGKAGLSFVRHPRQFIGIPDDHGVVTRENGLAQFGGSKTAFTVQAGARIGYAIHRRISLYLNPQMHFFTGRSIAFSEKNISKAIENGGDFNFDVFKTLQYDKKNESMYKMGLNLGLAMRLTP